ncbi:hypothetical protein C8R45DRAFT_1113224 [Mycena sanguinolenta]|nr:hypothetical protein C8R45DRAFT_1113224 [Mycena sanguinolenta]
MTSAERLNNLRQSYHSYHDDVLTALHVMVGDAPRLNAIRDRGLALASAADIHQDVFPPAEYGTLQTSISEMVAALDLACHESMDPPDAPPLVAARRVRTGRRGRPRVEIDPQFLRAALELRGPTGIAPELDWHNLPKRVLAEAEVLLLLSSSAPLARHCMRPPESNAHRVKCTPSQLTHPPCQNLLIDWITPEQSASGPPPCL